MIWEGITIDNLLSELKKHYSDISFKIVENNIEGKINKDIFLELWITETDNPIWKNNKLVHVGVVQRHGTLQGSSCAVDNFEDLDKQVKYCISQGKEWAGIKEVRKKLI